MTVGMMYDLPSNFETPAMDVATAAVEPDIIVGIPPKSDVMSDMTIVFLMPTLGESPMINANAIDSGISNNAMVRPDKNSLINRVAFMM
jgi:hypothetical protein